MRSHQKLLGLILRVWTMAHTGVSVFGVLFGGLFWSPCKRDPIILGPYEVPMIFGNSHMDMGIVLLCGSYHTRGRLDPMYTRNVTYSKSPLVGDTGSKTETTYLESQWIVIMKQPIKNGVPRGTVEARKLEYDGPPTPEPRQEGQPALIVLGPFLKLLLVYCYL